MENEFFNIRSEIEKINFRIRSIFEKNKIYSILKNNNLKILEPNFWKNQSTAQKIIKEKKLQEDLIKSYEYSINECKELSELFDLAVEEKNQIVLNETLKNLNRLKSKTKKNEIKCFLSNESDSLNCYIEVHAGAGGTESQDWAEMLRKMYMKWALSKDFKTQIISEHKGDEAGIKSSTIKIEGDYVFGWLKSESGIHRLVRISPFDSGARRHTSFASVWVYPMIDENIDIEIIEKDLRIDTYRSSGAGGQHVNTTDSAVRITHMPTKIVVQCQNERSQHKNKETCMNMLKARLYDFQLKKREQENQNMESSKSEIGWGHQIRSYVLHPYRLVKDNRTNLESSNPDKILDGEIDEFLENSLYKIK
ncbi:peptide chain release factor 2 [Pelagibacteraceae bacterium]|nr:peptide chain release factor 2 [Candidatus Pelagibacter sp.]MDC1485563.1 peptide chain release factor 2 [Pelagibacteraceae bacterium]